jgi:glyoxylase-like metal-dependent hydrolase (beta-lactamase superfamily II)
MMILETVRVGLYDVNCYILSAEPGGRAIIIDPGADEDKIKRVLNKHRLKAGMVINTHGHFDHIGCDDKFGVPVYIHQDDLPLLGDPHLNLSRFIASSYSVEAQAKALADKEKIELDGLQLEVIHTPGHTAGGICLLLQKPVNNILFSGDTLFFQGVGRTDFSGANERKLFKSIKEKLFILPDETQVYPGHGPASTIGSEKNNNPFLE